MSQQALFDAPPPVSPLAIRTEPWFRAEGVTLYQGNCLEVMARMPANSVDAVVSDPPYGIGFMGKEWDTFDPNLAETNKRKAFQVGAGRMRNTDNPNLRGRSQSPAMSPSQIEYDYGVEGLREFQRWTMLWAVEALRVLKPGGHMLVCGAPRAFHRLFCGLEDAGAELRDCFAWLFGQGFPKSRNLDGDWKGWGTTLKPGWEPITVARKPIPGTVESNVLVWGVGALNIDGRRIDTAGPEDRDPRDGIGGEIGRWPANVLLDEQAASRLDKQAGIRKSGSNPTKRNTDKFRRVFGEFKGRECVPARGAQEGGASRFYFVAKPSRWERDFGCEDLPVRSAGECTDRKDGSAGLTPYAGAGRLSGGRNHHPTVKPVELMRWLIGLVARPGSVILDPFHGSGTTGMAAVLEGCEIVGIEKETEYLELQKARITALLSHKALETA